mgnify:CR=1 FL=1
MAADPTKIDKLEADLTVYVAKRLVEIDRELAFLKRVRESRGIGKVRKMSEDFVGERLAVRIEDFLL